MALTKVKASNITLATAAASSNDTTPATTQYVTTAINNLIDGAPATLNTLDEIAAALNDDAALNTTLTNAIAAKAPLASPAFTGTPVIGTSTAGALEVGSANSFQIQKSGVNAYINQSDSGPIIVRMGSGFAERMRIDSSGDARFAANATGAALIKGVSGNQTDRNTGGYPQFTFVGNEGTGMRRVSSNVLAFDNSGDESMRIDSSGKVGIGTASPSKSLSVKAPSGSNGGIDVFHNNGNKVAELVHSGSGDEGRLSLLDSGSTTVQFMGETGQNSYINSGNVGIGTISPQALFDVTVPNAKTASASVWGYLGKTNESSAYQALQCFQIGGNAADERRYEFQTIEQGVSNDGIICLQKSGGRVFIGHDSADGNNDKVSIAGSIGISNDGYIGAGSGWGPSNSAGSSSTIQLYSSSTGNMTFAVNYSAADAVFNMGGASKFVIKRSAAGTEAIQLYTQDGGVRIGALNSGYHHTQRLSGPSKYYWDNRCEASGGFHTYSDEKLKKEVSTITGALDKVAVMNGVTFKWKDAENRGSGDTGKQFGVLAQNMLEVDSDLPSLNIDPLAEAGNEETSEKYYSMDYSRITPFLIEAVKELKTKLEAAEARIATLEG